jgi:homopolymeric O-antigen transport system ATP-binding protein
MSDVVIRAENLGKKYKIRHQHEGQHYVALRDVLADKLLAPMRWLKVRNWMRNGQNNKNEVQGNNFHSSWQLTQIPIDPQFTTRSPQSVEDFWALKNISFEVKQGEVVGIIGRNGAGKSTLLKILSRITEPTEGRVRIRGRMASLLEVGTGFHPELTGRENIFLNGAILGMNKAEIKRKFDEIVDFAEVEKFIDTPVKHYSSGMYLRLAFAVAAHLEPEILVVDEVLAVGDAVFQQKCLGKIRQVATLGRTVLFVSHNMAAVRSLCSRVWVMNKGGVVCDDGVDGGISTYASLTHNEVNSFWKRTNGSGDVALIIDSVRANLTGEQPSHKLVLDIALQTLGSHKPAFIAIDIYEQIGTQIMQALPTVRGFICDSQKTHKVKARVNLPPLIPGSYRVGVWAGPHNTETLDEVKECVSFTVYQSPTAGRVFPHSADSGFIVPECEIEVQSN